MTIATDQALAALALIEAARYAGSEPAAEMRQRAIALAKSAATNAEAYPPSLYNGSTFRIPPPPPDASPPDNPPTP